MKFQNVHKTEKKRKTKFLKKKMMIIFLKKKRVIMRTSRQCGETLTATLMKRPFVLKQSQTATAILGAHQSSNPMNNTSGSVVVPTSEKRDPQTQGDHLAIQVTLRTSIHPFPFTYQSAPGSKRSSATLTRSYWTDLDLIRQQPGCIHDSCKFVDLRHHRGC